MAEADLAVTRATSIIAAFQELRRWRHAAPAQSFWVACWWPRRQSESAPLEHWLFREALTELKTFILDILKILYYLTKKKNVPLKMSTYI